MPTWYTVASYGDPCNVFTIYYNPQVWKGLISSCFVGCSLYEMVNLIELVYQLSVKCCKFSV